MGEGLLFSQASQIETSLNFTFCDTVGNMNDLARLERLLLFFLVMITVLRRDAVSP